MTEREATLNEVIALLRNLPSQGLYRAGGGYHAPSYDDAWRVAALEVSALARKSQWTTELPTEVGEFWAGRNDPEDPAVFFVEVHQEASGLAVRNGVFQSIPLASAPKFFGITHWMRANPPAVPK